MVGKPAGEREEHQALVAARRKAEERYAASPVGMRETAAYLRRSADAMQDSNDRDAMLRLAAGYECRAEEAFRRPSAGH